jgi:hypothetical protein
MYVDPGARCDRLGGPRGLWRKPRAAVEPTWISPSVAELTSSVHRQG